MTGFKSKREAARNRGMTDWFPVTIFPVRAGVYEVSNNVRPNSFAKWDGEKWCFISDSIREAELQIIRSWGMYLADGMKWRGFTREQ